MCGIAGIVGKSNRLFDENIFQQALQQLKHRGPDDGNVFVSSDKTVLLGHRRLAVMDRSPLSSQPYREKHYVLVFNGSIFNYNDLRHELTQAGYSFHTRGDTEVVLKAYMHWGTACFSKFNGFFAIAIYDEEQKKVILARDRYGEKPLLIYQHENYLVFSSEMRVFNSLHLPLTLSNEIIPLYFTYTFIPEPLSIYKEVTKLEPGTYWVIHHDSIEKQRYYSLNLDQTKVTSVKEACMQVRQLLNDSIKIRLYADVPIAVFLSGGLDSTIVTYLASHINPSIEAFTIGFPDYPYYDESSQARLTAQQFNIQHTVVEVSDATMEENLRDVLDALDEPYADSSAIAAYSLFKVIREHYRVVLTGDGGDELFGGYRKHRAWIRAQHFPRWQLFILKLFTQLPLPEHRSNVLADFVRKTRKFVQLVESDKALQYDLLARFNSMEDLNDLLDSSKKSELLPYIRKEISSENDFLKEDMQFVLLSDMLRKVDSMSMLNSVEARSPFLDYRIVDYVFSLPGSWKFDKNSGKKLLRQAFLSDIPQHVLRGRKRGFEVPLWKWLPRILLKDSLIFDVQFIKRQGIFRPNAIEELKSWLLSDEKSIKKHQFLIWSYIVFQAWYLKNYGE